MKAEANSTLHKAIQQQVLHLEGGNQNQRKQNKPSLIKIQT